MKYGIACLVGGCVRARVLLHIGVLKTRENTLLLLLNSLGPRGFAARSCAANFRPTFAFDHQLASYAG